MLIAKSHAILHKIERSKVILEEAYNIAQHLKSYEICNFIELCRNINDEEIAMKKRTQSMESFRKRRSRQSISSRNSLYSRSLEESLHGSVTGDPLMQEAKLSVDRPTLGSL